MNLLQKIVYKLLSLKEKSLKLKLEKHLKTSANNSTSKTAMLNNVTMTLNTETKKNVALVKESVDKIVKASEYHPHKLLAFIESKGTKVYKLQFADKILEVLNEEEGLICPQNGFKAFSLAVLTNSGLKLKTPAMFVMREGEIEPFYMVQQFYKWYALTQNLAGYDEKSQGLFKKYLYSKTEINFDNLKLDEIVGLQEAIARDREATDYALELAKAKDGSKNVLNKIQNEGSAEV